jgi:hypothetical protein
VGAAFPWGEVWIPTKVARDWRPYTVGRWVYTDDWGWYWVSDQAEDNWGWITFHYGRWVFDRELGWVWVAGKEWGPGWVQWRRGTQYVGWAPLPPDEIVVEYRDEPNVWIFVRSRDFVAPRLVGVILPARQQDVFIRETVVVNQTIMLRERGPVLAVNPGIAPTIIAAAVGRPLRTFEVRPRILAGTTQIQGAMEVRPQDLRQGRAQGTQPTVRETKNVIQPSRNVPPAQPLAGGEHGRLGDNPPRAARQGGRESTTGQGPTVGNQQQQQGQKRQPDQPQQPAMQGRRPDQQRWQPIQGGSMRALEFMGWRLSAASLPVTNWLLHRFHSGLFPWSAGRCHLRTNRTTIPMARRSKCAPKANIAQITM